MRFLLVLFALVLVGCAGSLGPAGDDDCQISLSHTPTSPLAGPDSEVRVSSNYSGAVGTRTYTWTIGKGGTFVPFQDAQSDHSEITFMATEPGTYDVTLDLSSSLGSFCPQASAHINVLLDNTAMDARLHITPPITVLAPLVDRAIQVHNATDYDMGPVVLEPGVMATGQVKNGSTSIAAYIQFIPQGMAGAIVETFAAANGAYSVRLLSQPHDVIVVPAVAGLAPRKIIGYLPTQTVLNVSAGDTITGTIRQGVTAIPNAKVQLTIDGVPTTLATSAANGTFTVQGVAVANAMVRVEVTPPPATGLPRFEASGLLDVAGPVIVTYGTLTLRNLVGVPVRRGGAAQANKSVIIVGTVASVGTVSAGTTVNGTGFVRIPATTDAGGNLPSLLAPAGPLFAVTTVGVGDRAIGAVDLTSSIPTQIDAPAPAALVAQATDGTVPLDGAVLDLVPTHALGLAGVASMHFTADAMGRVTTVVPAGGSFDVRWSDPASRRAPKLDADTTLLSRTYVLPPAIYITGDLTVTGSSNPVVGASVQILCATCSGLDRNRPIAEVASDPHGTFTLAVPDPGAM